MMKSPVTYSREQRQFAKDEGLSLVCVDAWGVCFAAPVDKETAFNLCRWLTENILKSETPKPAKKTVKKGGAE